MSLIKISIITGFMFLTLDSYAQVEYLRLSPRQKIEQRVGATDMTLIFSRPQLKGRKIFGELVPYGKLWRTGANENTTLSFDHRIQIGTTIIEAGTYSLLTKPMESTWEIYFYKDTDQLDVPNPLDSTKLIYLTTVVPTKLPKVEETLVINFYSLTETTANLGIAWETTEIKIPINFFTREAMEAKIDKEFKQNIFDYSITASYYAQRNIELHKAKKLQELAMELKETPSSWDFHSYGTILFKLGEKEEAIKAIHKSLDLAKETNNAYLIEENTQLLKEMKK